MHNEFGGLGIETLQAMLAKEENRLTTDLLSGKPWKEVQDQRTRVTKLSIAVYKKLQLLREGHPAENQQR